MHELPILLFVATDVAKTRLYSLIMHMQNCLDFGVDKKVRYLNSIGESLLEDDICSIDSQSSQETCCQRQLRQLNFPPNRLVSVGDICQLDSPGIFIVPSSPIGTTSPFRLSYNSQTYVSGNAGPVQQQCCSRLPFCKAHLFS